MPDDTVVDADVSLVDDDEVAVLAREVGAEVEGEDYGAVAGVFEGDHASRGGAVGHGGEDILDGGLGAEDEPGFCEGVEGCLVGV